MSYFSFGLIADCQYTDADSIVVPVPNTDFVSHRYFRRSIAKLETAVTEFNRWPLGFVAHLGDLIDRDLTELPIIQAPLSKATAPVLHVLGNHDFEGSVGNPDAVVEAFGMPARYYSRTFLDLRFIFLDSNELGLIEHLPDSPPGQVGEATIAELEKAGAINAYPWNGGLGVAQLAWLEAELNDAYSQGQRVILLAHHPVFPPNIHNMLDTPAVLDLIDRYDNISAFFNGHNHEGNYGERNGVTYVTLPGVVEGGDNAFAIVDMYANRLELRGYGRQANLDIPL